MRRVIAAALFLVFATPAVAQAPSQWFKCAFTPPKGFKTHNGFKVMKTYVSRFCSDSQDTAYYEAIELFSTKIYRGDVTAEPDYCKPTHEACVR